MEGGVMAWYVEAPLALNLWFGVFYWVAHLYVALKDVK